jgi:hypothetical protein
MFIELGRAFPGVSPRARDYQVRIEVKLGHHRKWRHLVTFPLRAAHITSPDRYITYSNSAHDLTEEVVAEAKAAMEEFARKMLHPNAVVSKADSKKWLADQEGQRPQ